MEALRAAQDGTDPGTEEELLRAVMKQCHQLGLLVHHCGDSRHCHGAVGLPDLIIAGPHGHLFAELKDWGSPMRPAQVIWKWNLIAAGAPWYCWTPLDWHNGTIQKILRGIA